MSYVKNTWTEGDVITADKLNNIEEGVSQSNSVYEIELTEEEIEQMESATLVKNITEEDYLKIRNSNVITFKVSGGVYFLTRNINIPSNYDSTVYLNIMALSLESNPQALIATVSGNENSYIIRFSKVNFNLST